MPQLFTLSLDLKTDNNRPVHPIQSRQLHALFFSLLAGVNQDLATAVHDANEKPFAMWLDAQESCRAKVTIAAFANDLCLALQELSQRGNLLGMLDRTEAAVSIAAAKPIAVLQLWDEAAGQRHAGKLRVNFLTPTSFRRNGVQILFPEPALLFKSVYAKALTYGGDYIAANLVSPDEFSGQMQVSRYELATKEINYGKYKIIGCTGYGVYDYRRIKTPYLLNSLAFLSRFAEYTGIGYKTTMGLGRVGCTLGGIV